MKDWSSMQYLKFKSERTQPAYDLLNRIPLKKVNKILDIGCGPGNSTQILYEKYPNTYILGIDSSPHMIEAAKKEHPKLNFMLCDAGKDLKKLDHNFDIVFSNACIQWIPNHTKLLKNMMKLLRPGGILAIQTPMNYDEPIHKIIEEVTQNETWIHEFKSPRNFHNLKQDEYFDLLSEISKEFSLWETTYFHKMKSHEDIMEWYKGTGLRPYINVLSSEKKSKFEQEILDKVILAYPKQKNGEIIFKFPRFFFLAINN